MDTMELASKLVELRIKLNETNDALADTRHEILNDVKDIDEEIARLTEQKNQRMENHVLASRLASLQQASDYVDAECKAVADELNSNWSVADKTVYPTGGNVTRSTRTNVKVTDAEALAKELLERKLWGFVKKLEVDAKTIMPIIKVGDVKGVEIEESHSISVKLIKA